MGRRRHLSLSLLLLGSCTGPLAEQTQRTHGHNSPPKAATEPASEAGPDLRLAAYRRGPIDLLANSGRLIFVLDDVPVPVYDGQLHLHPAWFRGRPPVPPWSWAQQIDGRVSAVVGDLEDGGSLILSREFVQGYFNPVHGVDILEFRDGVWTPVSQTRDEIWSFAHATTVERAPGTLALAHWGLDFSRYERSRSEQLHERYEELVDKRPTPEFLWLDEGVEAPLPRLPPSGRILADTAVTTDDGLLGVLLEGKGCSLVIWPIDSLDPILTRLADFDSVTCGPQTRLRSHDGTFLVTGHDVDRPYFAQYESSTFEVLTPSSLPRRDDTNVLWISAAARASGGEWWVLANEGDPSREPAEGYVEHAGLWRRDAHSKRWSAITLSRVEVPEVEERWWFFEQMSGTWMRFPPRASFEADPQPLDLRGQAGELWVAVSLDSDEVPPYLRRYGVLTSAAGDEVLELPATDHLAVETRSFAGADDCVTTTLTWHEMRDGVTIEALVEDKWDALVAAAIVREDDEWALVTHAFIGDDAGRRVLVLEAEATDSTTRRALEDSVSRALEREVEPSCRSYQLVESVGFPAREATIRTEDGT